MQDKTSNLKEQYKQRLLNFHLGITADARSLEKLADELIALDESAYDDACLWVLKEANRVRESLQYLGEK